MVFTVVVGSKRNERLQEVVVVVSYQVKSRSKQQKVALKIVEKNRSRDYLTAHRRSLSR
jgi:hypothetical protein